MNVLISYWAHRRRDPRPALAAHPGAGVFCDSGAYSAMTVGAAIDVREYGRWLVAHRDAFDVYSNLDVIGDADASARNQAVLEGEFALSPMPVFHPGEPWDALERLVRDYPLVGLGGMARKEVAGSKPTLMAWLVRCFRVAGDRARFHGFGLTDWRCISQLPFASVDSTTWMTAARYGSLSIFTRAHGVRQARADKVGRYERDLRALGFSLAEALAACRPRALGGDPDLGRRIALASFAACESAVRARFGADFRLYLSGLV